MIKKTERYWRQGEADVTWDDFKDDSQCKWNCTKFDWLSRPLRCELSVKIVLCHIGLKDVSRLAKPECFDWQVFSLNIVLCSGDGTLSVFNIRRKRFEARSENQENELLSVVVMKVSKHCCAIEFILGVRCKHRFQWSKDDVIVLAMAT